MTSLVVLDFDATGIKQPSRSAIAAATKLGGELHGLVAGSDVAAIAEAAAKLPGLSKILVADDAAYANALAEPLSALIVSLAGNYSHIFAAATAVGKNVLPRAAALLDVQPISDISDVIDADTFVRPIYAGNALATVKSADAKKVVTVRASSFDPVPAEGGPAAINKARARENGQKSARRTPEFSQDGCPYLTDPKTS